MEDIILEDGLKSVRVDIKNKKIYLKQFTQDVIEIDFNVLTSTEQDVINETISFLNHLNDKIK